MYSFVQFCLRHMIQRRRRLFSTALSIAIGVALVVIVSAIGEVGKTALRRELDGFGLGSLTISVDKGVAGAALSEEKLADIRTLEGVESAIPILLEYTRAHMKELHSSVAVWGIDSGSSQIISVQPLHGRLLQPGDITEERTVCLVDENMARAFYGRSNIVGKYLTLELGGEKATFEIVGVVESGGSLMQSMLSGYMPFFAYLPYSTLQQHTREAGFDQIAVELVRDEEVDAVGVQIVERLSTAYGEQPDLYHVDNMAVPKQKVERIMELFSLLLLAISSISLVVSGLGIMTVMTASVHERTREIGIKKALGARNMLILLEFLIQGLVLSLAGAMLGCAIGVGAALGGCALLGVAYAPDWRVLIGCIAAAAMVGTLCSAGPALSAAALDPVQALAHE